MLDSIQFKNCLNLTSLNLYNGLEAFSSMQFPLLGENASFFGAQKCVEKESVAKTGFSKLTLLNICKNSLVGSFSASPASVIGSQES